MIAEDGVATGKACAPGPCAQRYWRKSFHIQLLKKGRIVADLNQPKRVSNGEIKMNDLSCLAERIQQRHTYTVR